MGADFKVIVHEGTERAENFMKVFGRREVNVKSFVPHWANVPGFDEPQRVYMLDLAMLTPDERARMVTHLAGMFGLTEARASDAIASIGVPILASDCTLVIENPHKWLD